MVDIKKSKKGINKYGVRKYAKVPSESSNKTYLVTKIRKRNTRNYRYTCSCPDFVYRQHPCKHIRDFKTAEQMSLYKGRQISKP